MDYSYWLGSFGNSSTASGGYYRAREDGKPELQLETVGISFFRGPSVYVFPYIHSSLLTFFLCFFFNFLQFPCTSVPFALNTSYCELFQYFILRVVPILHIASCSNTSYCELFQYLILRVVPILHIASCSNTSYCELFQYFILWAVVTAARACFLQNSLLNTHAVAK